MAYRKLAEHLNTNCDAPDFPYIYEKYENRTLYLKTKSNANCIVCPQKHDGSNSFINVSYDLKLHLYCCRYGLSCYISQISENDKKDEDKKDKDNKDNAYIVGEILQKESSDIGLQTCTKLAEYLDTECESPKFPYIYEKYENHRVYLKTKPDTKCILCHTVHRGCSPFINVSDNSKLHFFCRYFGGLGIYLGKLNGDDNKIEYSFTKETSKEEVSKEEISKEEVSKEETSSDSSLMSEKMIKDTLGWLAHEKLVEFYDDQNEACPFIFVDVNYPYINLKTSHSFKCPDCDTIHEKCRNFLEIGTDNFEVYFRCQEPFYATHGSYLKIGRLFEGISNITPRNKSHILYQIAAYACSTFAEYMKKNLGYMTFPYSLYYIRGNNVSLIGNCNTKCLICNDYHGRTTTLELDTSNFEVQYTCPCNEIRRSVGVMFK